MINLAPKSYKLLGSGQRIKNSGKKSFWIVYALSLMLVIIVFNFARVFKYSQTMKNKNEMEEDFSLYLHRSGLMKVQALDLDNLATEKTATLGSTSFLTDNNTRTAWSPIVYIPSYQLLFDFLISQKLHKIVLYLGSDIKHSPTKVSVYTDESMQSLLTYSAPSHPKWRITAPNSFAGNVNWADEEGNILLHIKLVAKAGEQPQSVVVMNSHHGKWGPEEKKEIGPDTTDPFVFTVVMLLEGFLLQFGEGEEYLYHHRCNKDSFRKLEKSNSLLVEELNSEMGNPKYEMLVDPPKLLQRVYMEIEKEPRFPVNIYEIQFYAETNSTRL